MATTYPTTLPEVPHDRWGAQQDTAAATCTGTTATSRWTIDADSAEQAERRLLAHVDRDYEDDLRGAVATAQPTAVTGRWHVTLAITGEF